MFLDNEHEDKKFMAAAIPKIQDACNFVTQAIFVTVHSQFVTISKYFLDTWMLWFCRAFCWQDGNSDYKSFVLFLKAILFYSSIISRELMRTVLRKTNLMHNLFLVHFVNLYMFRAYLGPSSGCTTVCIQQFQSNHNKSSSGLPRNFVQGWGVQQIQRERGSGSGSLHLVRGSGGSCNLVQEISFHIVKFS